MLHAGSGIIAGAGSRIPCGARWIYPGRIQDSMGFTYPAASGIRSCTHVPPSSAFPNALSSSSLAAAHRHLRPLPPFATILESSSSAAVAFSLLRLLPRGLSGRRRRVFCNVHPHACNIAAARSAGGPAFVSSSRRAPQRWTPSTSSNFCRGPKYAFAAPAGTYSSISSPFANEEKRTERQKVNQHERANDQKSSPQCP